ncbi:MAG: sterol desaturase family protein, partial [Rhodospirillales bacterium]|nr:sterol desaturase family protein [Rhodospirillales bacterium]
HLFQAPLGMVLPIFLFVILAEALVMILRGRAYPVKHTGVSLLIWAGHLVTQAATHGILYTVLAVAVYEFRLTTIPIALDWHHLPAIVALFLLTDFAFYVEHRCSHRVRLMWASHSVHHSIEEMVFSAAFRLSWTPLLSGVFLFYLPIIWIGFDPKYVMGFVSVGLMYQFFVHTELVPRIAGLEWLINTPSAHRVHHASNPEYLDKNFGGVLLIWDRLFGTYEAERPEIKTVYGLVHPRSRPYNPVVVCYEEFWSILKDLFRARRWRDRWNYLWAPPGWTPPQ